MYRPEVQHTHQVARNSVPRAERRQAEHLLRQLQDAGKADLYVAQMRVSGIVGGVGIGRYHHEGHAEAIAQGIN